jgi:hypothetical protein
VLKSKQGHRPYLRKPAHLKSLSIEHDHERQPSRMPSANYFTGSFLYHTEWSDSLRCNEGTTCSVARRVFGVGLPEEL